MLLTGQKGKAHTILWDFRQKVSQADVNRLDRYKKMVAHRQEKRFVIHPLANSTDSAESLNSLCSEPGVIHTTNII